MKLFSTIAEFIRDLRSQKLRTVMTIFGIIWGTVAIIELLAFGYGFQKQTMKSMNGFAPYGHKEQSVAHFRGFVHKSARFLAMSVR